MESDNDVNEIYHLGPFGFGYYREVTKLINGVAMCNHTAIVSVFIGKFPVAVDFGLALPCLSNFWKNTESSTPNSTTTPDQDGSSLPSAPSAEAKTTTSESS